MADGQLTIVTGDGYTEHHLEQLRSVGEVLLRPAISAQELRERIPDADAYLLGGDERLDADLIAIADRLDVVSLVGVGIASFIDQAAAEQRGITIYNTPGANSRAVAEHIVGLVLSVTRNLGSCFVNSRTPEWSAGASRELGSATVGIVGLGNIGRETASILRAGFGTRVIYWSRHRKPDLEDEFGIEYMSLDALAEQADVVIPCTSLTGDTEMMIDAEFLRSMPRHAAVVNCADPRIVDPAALKDALDDGAIRVAAFDGYWQEPIPGPADDRAGLLALPPDRFQLTPHVAAKTPETWSRMVDQAVHNLVARPATIRTGG